ncbi:MAG: TIGR02147 family protein [Chitinivibrionales bacterium]|nr:TIGR02147 family protein [Chitinivibrionales bacterium]
MRQPNVFDYLDYRALLKDLYEYHRERKPFFSYRYIGQKVGFKSAGFFSNILHGRRNISSETIFHFAELFKFSRQETEYFEALVLYDQAKQHGRKRHYYEKLLAMRRSKVRGLAADQYEYFQKWYYVAVRELLNFYPFKGDYADLARRVRPYIKPSEAKAAVELLERLELIRRRDDGTYELTDRTVTSYPDVPLVAVHNFQLATMELAKESIDRFPREKRSISTLTLSLSADAYKRIEQKLSSFRREMLDLVKNDPNVADRIYQFNFQVFPLTDIPDDPT